MDKPHKKLARVKPATWAWLLISILLLASLVTASLFAAVRLLDKRLARLQSAIEGVAAATNMAAERIKTQTLNRANCPRTFDYFFYDREHTEILDATLSFDRTILDHLTIRCMDPQGKEIQRFFDFAYYRLSNQDYINYYLFDVPKKCLAHPHVHIRIQTRHSSCVEPEGVELHRFYRRQNNWVVNSEPIEGYVDKQSYRPGEFVRLNVHSLSPEFDWKLIRHGVSDETILERTRVPGKPQNYLLHAAIDGANWEETTRIQIPATARSGIYTLQLKNRVENKDNLFQITFLVRARAGSKDKLLFLASTNTWQAYNGWGQSSHYGYSIADGLRREISNVVNFQRPNVAATPTGDRHLAVGDIQIARWLDSHQYGYDMASDLDMEEDPNVLTNKRVLVLGAHPEYWTQNEYRAIDRFLAKGGNIISLGGNTAYYRSLRIGSKLETRKDASIHVSTDDQGGLWADSARPPSALLGVSYLSAAFGSFAPYRVQTPDHWVFEGTNVKRDDLLGAGKLENGSYDDGASGHEMDRVDLVSPSNTVILATGINPSRSGQKGDWGAQMVYYQHPSGGEVFSSGSITFSRWMAADKDKSIDRLTQNVFDRFLKEKRP